MPRPQLSPIGLLFITTMKRRLLDEAPFARLTFPFAAGMALQAVMPDLFLCVPFLIGIIFLVLHFTSLSHLEARFRNQNYFAFACFALFFTAGGATLALSRQAETPKINPNTYAYARARIESVEADTGRSVGCRATIVALADKQKQNTTTDIPILLRIEQDSCEGKLQTGSIILFVPRIAPIANRKNPEAFDYAALMRHRGYVYTQYLPLDRWTYTGQSELPLITRNALALRDTCLNLIDRGDFSPQARNILKALLIGYTGDLDDSQREAFSVAGLSHVLAVSGLHLGIIWAVVAALLAPLGWLRLHRLRALVIMILLWGYAYVTGLSPSVIRACVMASVVLTGILIGRKAYPMNSLFVAAFVMLLYNPHYLFQVGFQLSFLSVFSILLFYRPLYNLLPQGNRFARSTASLLAVSAAAQLGTLPLVIYYFHTLPLAGLITNLIVVPLLPLLLGGGFLWLFLAGIGMAPALLGRGVNALADGLDRFSRLVDGYSWCAIENIWIEPGQLIWLFVFIFGGAAVLLSREARGLILLLSTLFLFLLVDTLNGHTPLRNVWVAYQESGGTTTLNFIDNGHNLLLPIDTLPTRTTEREAQRFWLRNGIDAPQYLTDSTSHGHLAIALPYIVFGDKRIIVLNDERWKGVTSSQRMSLDYAVVAPGFRGKIDPIRQIFDIREVILTHNLPYFQRKALQEECQRLRIRCHCVRTDGAFVAPMTTRL